MVVMGLVAACDSKSVVAPPVSSSSQVGFDGKLIWSSPVIIVLVVDDAATTEAAGLRAQVVDIVRTGLLSEVDHRWGSSCGNPDPAAWHPGDMRVVLARPSAPDGEALLTSIEMPALAWTTKHSTAEEVDVVAAATAKALEDRLAGAGEPYRPLRAAKRAMDLVNGARPPESDSEAALVASLPPKALARLLIASGRDDNDVSSVESLALAPEDDPFGAPDWDEILGPFTAQSGTCHTDGQGKTRLEAWGNKDRAQLAPWPCDADPTVKGILTFGGADCWTACHDHPLPVAPDGTTDCRIFIDQDDLDRCEPERGHHDPDGKPELIDRNGKTLRRCEVNQLTGAALDACRTSLACPNCSSGFCATQVPELTHAQYCEAGQHDWPLRYTGEAIGAPSDWIHVVCNTVSTGE